MIFPGLQRTTLADFPGRVAAIVFTQGCNFRCPYCHNPELVVGRSEHGYSEEEILEFLRSRGGRLGGVVVTGGEPTIQAELPRFLGRVKELGLAVKVDTNGSRPAMIRQLIGQGLVDYIAMDIKAPLDRYHLVARVPVDMAALSESIRLIATSGVDHEFRTTVARPLLSAEDLCEIGQLARQGRRYLLQPFKPAHLLDSAFAESSTTFSAAELALVSASLSTAGIACAVR